MFNADLALSVTMTAISTILAIIALPLNLLIYSNLTYDDDVVSQLNWGSLFISLTVVIGAIVTGLTCSEMVHSHRFNKIANKLGSVAGVFLVLLSITMSNAGEGDMKIWNRSWQFYLGIALPCIIGLVIANIFTAFMRLVHPERVTVSIECCYQNVGIATSVALTMFEGNDLAEAMGVPLYYGLVEAVTLGLYCVVAWKVGWTKAPTDVSFCTMILESYEVILAEKKEIESIEVLLRSGRDDKDRPSSYLSEDGGIYYKYVERHSPIKNPKFEDITVKTLQLSRFLKEPSDPNALILEKMKENEDNHETDPSHA